MRKLGKWLPGSRSKLEKEKKQEGLKGKDGGQETRGTGSKKSLDGEAGKEKAKYLEVWTKEAKARAPGFRGGTLRGRDEVALWARECVVERS